VWKKMGCVFSNKGSDTYEIHKKDERSDSYISYATEWWDNYDERKIGASAATCDQFTLRRSQFDNVRRASLISLKAERRAKNIQPNFAVKIGDLGDVESENDIKENDGTFGYVSHVDLDDDHREIETEKEECDKCTVENRTLECDEAPTSDGLDTTSSESSDDESTSNSIDIYPDDLDQLKVCSRQYNLETKRDAYSLDRAFFALSYSSPKLTPKRSTTFISRFPRVIPFVCFVSTYFSQFWCLVLCLVSKDCLMGNLFIIHNLPLKFI
jgi:hypothetical protein